MSIYDINNLDHDPKLAEALGQMVVAWAHAEMAMLNTFACVINVHVNRVLSAYYRIPTFESRTKVILALIDEWEKPKPARQKTKKAVSKLAKLSSTRNHWIHANWCMERETKETILFDFRAPETTPNRRMRPVKAADVQNHVRAVRTRTDALTDLIPIPFEP